jgi:hypothetical protein
MRVEDELGEEREPVEKERMLISARAASEIAGVGRNGWPRLAMDNKLTPVPHGKRILWRRVEVEALIGLRQSA